MRAKNVVLGLFHVRPRPMRALITNFFLRVARSHRRSRPTVLSTGDTRRRKAENSPRDSRSVIEFCCGDLTRLPEISGLLNHTQIRAVSEKIKRFSD
jgi:hypothetical protein